LFARFVLEAKLQNRLSGCVVAAIVRWASVALSYVESAKVASRSICGGVHAFHWMFCAAVELAGVSGW